VRFRLDDLEDASRLKIMDTAFALMDRVRFELMRRLGWVEEVPGGGDSIIRLVEEAWRRDTDFAREVPRLAGNYPDYEAYVRLNPIDRVVFVRRLIPRAVQAFRERLEAGER